MWELSVKHFPYMKAGSNRQKMIAVKPKGLWGANKSIAFLIYTNQYNLPIVATKNVLNYYKG